MPAPDLFGGVSTKEVPLLVAHMTWARRHGITEEKLRQAGARIYGRNYLSGPMPAHTDLVDLDRGRLVRLASPGLFNEGVIFVPAEDLRKAGFGHLLP